MSEAELTAEVFKVLIREGAPGDSKVQHVRLQILLGHIAFGESPLSDLLQRSGGNYGLGPEMQLMGSRETGLPPGTWYSSTQDAYKGYQSDKTMTYVFGRPLTAHAVRCIKMPEIQERMGNVKARYSSVIYL